MEYLVKWQIDIEAESHEDAARQAQTIQRRSKSIATVFEVSLKNAKRSRWETKSIDLSEVDDEIIRREMGLGPWPEGT